MWTGTCNPNPDIQRQIDSDMKRTLVRTGSAVGELIGTIVLPGVGTIVGKCVISRFVFFILLSSLPCSIMGQQEAGEIREH